jgi:hypothetical protein
VLTFLFPVAWGLKGVYDGRLPEGASERPFERSRSISATDCAAIGATNAATVRGFEAIATLP